MMNELFSVQNTGVFLISLALATLAAKQIGLLFTKMMLPLISGFLATGIIAGPFVLDLITLEAVKNLRFVDQIALGYIAFAAGGELYLKDLKTRQKSIKWTTLGLVVGTFSLGAFSVFMLSEFIPFMSEMPVAGRVAVSILAGSILVARSPSSAIAIVKELRARGPFTQTVLGVTVIMDGVVIVLFAINTSLADALLTKISFNGLFILLLAAELSASLALGIGTGKVLEWISSRRWNTWVKIAATLLTGYAVFVVSDFIRHYSARNWSSEVLLEPLLICMIGGFRVVNFGFYREDFQRILHRIGPVVYLVFFTLIGASLRLDILANIWPVALALFFARIASIFAGSFAGGLAAREPMAHNRLSWMAYITQAGIGMGLATEVAVEFPGWGQAFATLMIAIIVINQIVGPLFFKSAIYMLKEAHPPAQKTEAGIIHNAIIFGSGGQAMALARQLHSHHWEVKLASPGGNGNEKVVGSDVDIHPITDLSPNELRFLGAGGAGAIVAMLSDDEGLRICELAQEHFGQAHLVVQLNDRANYDLFKSFGASVVVPSTAMISLLDHFVRSPSAVSLLLGEEADQDIIDIEVHNELLIGAALKDLRLPEDVLVVSVHRRGAKLNVTGGLLFKKGDVVTIAGSWDHLEELRVKYES